MIPLIFFKEWHVHNWHVLFACTLSCTSMFFSISINRETHYNNKGYFKILAETFVSSAFLD